LLKASLTRSSLRDIIKSFLDDYVPERDYSVLKIRLEKANSLLSEFENVHIAIELAEDINDESRQLFEDNYYEYITKAQEYVELGKNNAASSHDTTNTELQAVLYQLSNLTSNDNSVKFPTITLPKFDGKYEEWLSFENSFTALIHNNRKTSKSTEIRLFNPLRDGCKYIYHLFYFHFLFISSMFHSFNLY